MWSVKSSDIIDRLVISGHENLQNYHHWQPEQMTTDKLICAVESGKYEGATFVVGEEYIMESTFLAKLFTRVWFNVVTELEDYLYLNALLFLIEFLDLAGLGGVKGWCGSVFIKEEKRHWWLRMETSTPSCCWTFWKTSAVHTKDELMEITFGCKTTTFAHIWLLQWKSFLKHMGRCWYHDPLAP